jgi:hypothetical protein
MAAFITLLSPLGLLSVIFLFFILARLSEKLGAVTRMAPYYRWFWVGTGFLAVGLLSQLACISASLTGQSGNGLFASPLFYLVTYHIPLVIGVSIGLAITWRYWSWLLTERDG